MNFENVIEVKTVHYGIQPVPAPRMTRSDKWRSPPRPCVQRYFKFRDQVKQLGVRISSPCRITFRLPMPKSWSKKKRASFNGKPHMNVPDLDNLIKALCDAVHDDDAHLWSIYAEKFWGEEPEIRVELP